MTEEEKKTMAAFDLLMESGRLSEAHAIREQFSKHDFSRTAKPISRLLSVTTTKNNAATASQLMMIEIAGFDFNKKLLHSIVYADRLSHPLPKEWQNILLENGINVDRRASSSSFRRFLINKWWQNAVQVVKTVLSLLLKKNTSQRTGRYVEFADITKDCLPSDNSDHSYTVFDWYLGWNGKVDELSEIRHNLKETEAFSYKSIDIAPAKHFTRFIFSFRLKLIYMCWAVYAIPASLVSLFFGNWMQPLLLYESGLGKLLRLADKKYLALEYFFSVSTIAFRPLWTYVAQDKGSAVTMYTYSSSFQGFKTPHGYVDQEYIFKTNTWPRLLYWTAPLAAHLGSIVPSNVIVQKVDPICFSDHPFTLSSEPGIYVAVFDVTPTNPYRNTVHLPENRYRSYKNGKKFLRDIYDVLSGHGVKMVWKRKRLFGQNHDPDFIQFCEEFEKLPNVISVHPAVSAFRVVEQCDYCITMPFTSTGFVGEYFQKESVFYDPSSELFKDDRGAQGLPIISGIEELKAWAEKHFQIHTKPVFDDVNQVNG